MIHSSPFWPHGKWLYPSQLVSFFPFVSLFSLGCRELGAALTILGPLNRQVLLLEYLISILLPCPILYLLPQSSGLGDPSFSQGLLLKEAAICTHSTLPPTGSGLFDTHPGTREPAPMSGSALLPTAARSPRFPPGWPPNSPGLQSSEPPVCASEGQRLWVIPEVLAGTVS